MSRRLRALSAVEHDIEAAYNWYVAELPFLGREFLDEIRNAYDRIEENPLKYQPLKYTVRRTLLRRFPYVVYFVVDEQSITIIAVLHASRAPERWQQRTGHFVNEPSP